jgi:hypothetical protein
MWQWVSNSVQARRARKAAVAAISPIVEDSRYRLGGISDVVWSDPYIIGFIVMLISVIARLEIAKVAGNDLCRIQCGAWEDITSMKGGEMAEELLLLSTVRNREFELGCHNAATFGSILFGSSELMEGGGVPQIDAVLGSHRQREDVSAAWSQFFDAHVLSQCIRNGSMQSL